MSRLAPYRKCILATVMAFLTALGAAWAQGGVTFNEFATAWIYALVTGLGIYAVPNAPQPAVPDTWVEKRLRTDEGNQPRR